MIFLSLIAGLLVGFCIIRPLLKNTGNTAQTAAAINQTLLDAMDDEQRKRVVTAQEERFELVLQKRRRNSITGFSLIAACIAACLVILAIGMVIHH